MKLLQYALVGMLSLLPCSSSMLDERSELIARMKKTMASQDTAKEDPRDLRDRLVSARECALLIEDFAKIKGLEAFNEEYAYDSGAVSIAFETKGGDILVYNAVGNYSPSRQITLAQAREYLKRREKK